MKKAVKTALVFITLLSLFSLPTFAYTGDVEDFLKDFSLIIPEGTGIDINDPGSIASGIGFGYIINELLSAFSGQGSGTPQLLFLTVSLSTLTALCYTFSGDAAGRGAGIVSLGIVFTFILPSSLFATSSLRDASEFFSYAVPIMSGVSAAGGGACLAGVQSIALSISIWLIGEGVVKLLLPLSLFLCVFSLHGSLSEGAAFGIAKNIRGAFLWGMGALCALFSGVLGLQSILMGAKDSMTIRTARYAISNMIPIVGSSVSGALSTLGGALSYVKDTLGIGTVAVLLSLLLPTLITLLLHRLILSLGSGIVKLISGQDKNAFSVFLIAFDTLIASYAFSSLIYIIETVIFIKSGVAIL